VSLALAFEFNHPSEMNSFFGVGPFEGSSSVEELGRIVGSPSVSLPFLGGTVKYALVPNNL